MEDIRMRVYMLASTIPPGKKALPKSQDVALHLGYPLYQRRLRTWMTILLVRNRDDDESEQECTVNDENTAESTTVERNRKFAVHDEEIRRVTMDESGEPRFRPDFS
ncbi:hypothetical protein C8R44DRAFT_742146 [Mycena epipterygia]|nr:hypothetical protein C8R44DRAFT_742146 [Mycena epipterygia]